jgi:hypothetical protein
VAGVSGSAADSRSFSSPAMALALFFFFFFHIAAFDLGEQGLSSEF